MGIPYSKQINLAFDQVTPLVAAGFKVLQTTKNITFLLAAIQVLTALFLFLILGALLALIITVSPDLEYERRMVVTPVMRGMVGRVMGYAEWVKMGVWIVGVGVLVGAGAGWWVTREGVEGVDVMGESVEGEVEAGEFPGS
ncbi:hypothetical protein BGZ60DRAFT_564059 [Tricladium varicosporioides]|nr:hypothetical protein BGZ60DRAFT_564059 [Hymenoscyphus varicosporioides]